MSKVLVAYFSASGVTAGMAKGAKVVAGKRFGNSASADELKAWAQEWV